MRVEPSWLIPLSGYLFAAPTVSFVDSFNAGMTAGWSVTVSGVSFGASLDTTPTSRLGLSDCGTAAWVSVTSVACFLTRGDGVVHQATVTAVGVVGTRTSTFSYDGNPAFVSSVQFICCTC